MTTETTIDSLINERPESIAAAMNAKLAAVDEIEAGFKSIPEYVEGEMAAVRKRYEVGGVTPRALQAALTEAGDIAANQRRVALRESAIAESRALDFLVALTDKQIDQARTLRPINKNTPAIDRVAYLLEREEIRKRYAGGTVQQVRDLYNATEDGALAAWLEEELETSWATLKLEGTDGLMDLQRDVEARREARVPIVLRDLRAQLEARWISGGAFGPRGRMQVHARLAS